MQYLIFIKEIVSSGRLAQLKPAPEYGMIIRNFTGIFTGCSDKNNTIEYRTGGEL